MTPSGHGLATTRPRQASTVPSVTMNTAVSDVAAICWPEDDAALRRPARRQERRLGVLGGAGVVAYVLKGGAGFHATPVQPNPERCWVAPGGGLILVRDAFGGPRVEGAFLLRLGCRRRHCRSGQAVAPFLPGSDAQGARLMLIDDVLGAGGAKGRLARGALAGAWVLEGCWR